MGYTHFPRGREGVLLNMVLSARFTRPPGTAAFSRGAGLLALVLMLLSGAPQVAAKPIMQYNDTKSVRRSVQWTDVRA